MKILIFSIRNIINQIRKNSMIYIVMCSQIIAIILLLFVYGVFSSYNAVKQELTIDSYTISAGFDDDNRPKAEELKEAMIKILDGVQDRLDYFYVMGSLDGIMLNIHNEYHKGIFEISEAVSENVMIEQGRMLSNEDIDNAEKVVVGENIGNEGEQIELGNETYTIIGVSKRPFDTDMKVAEISFPACPDKAGICNIILNFSELPKQSDYILFRDELKNLFGDRVYVDEFEVKDAEELTGINSVILFAVIIGLGIALDTGMLYAYIIHKRKKQMAVFSLNGAGRVELFLINEAEIIMLSIVTSFAGIMIFKLYFEKILQNLYENVTEIFNLELYMKLSGIYMLCMISITSFVTFIYSDSNIMKMLRRSE